MKELLHSHKRPILYVIVGGINTGVDLVLFRILYLFSPLAPALCQVFSYLAGVFCSFLLNRNFTFKSSEQEKVPKQAFRFLLINGLSLSLSALGIHLFYLAGVNTMFAKVLITGLTAVLNYFAYKLFVFRDKRS